MIIVDTSVWIDFFNDVNSKQSRILEDLLLNDDSLCINGLIEMEILQGIRNETQFVKLKKYLQPFQYFPVIKSSHIAASIDIFRTCRKRGKTIRKSMDCLIAGTAMVEGLTILHKDRDFTTISKVIRDIRVIS